MIAVLTTPARPEYLAETIASLEQAGADAHALRVIFVDGDGGKMENLPFFSGWLTESLGPEPMGTRAALAGVLHAAARFSEDLLFFEDDVRAAPNAVRALELVEVPDDCGFLVACDIAQHGADVPMIVRRPGEGPRRWGSQAMKIPARSIAYMAARELAGTNWPHAADIALGRSLAAPPAPWPVYGVIAPSLFDHVGEHSIVTPEKTVGKEPGRACLNFIGEREAVEVARAIAAAERSRPRVQIAMMSIAGREPITSDTCKALSAAGLDELTIVPVLHYNCPPGRPSPEAPGWRVERHHAGLVTYSQAEIAARFRGRGKSPWLDFLRVIQSFDAGADAIFFEDDLLPCKNAVRRMVELEVPDGVGLVSFFDYRNEWPRPGLWTNPTGREFHGAQALKIPARVLPRLQALALENVTIPCWDIWLGRAMEILGLSIAHYAPSLVQHVGMASMYAPGVPRPMADNFPGEDFDALGPCPDPIPIVPRPPVKDVFCELHREFHPAGRTCPLPAG